MLERKNEAVNIIFPRNSSWVILSPIEQRIKEKIEKVGVPLKEWDIRINYGIKTGCNEAFIIDKTKRDELIKQSPNSVDIIRPILRGRDIKRYSYDFAELYLLNVHNGIREKNIPLVNIDDYPAIKTHLDQYWDKISVRDDRGKTPYNLRNCAYMDDFSKQKIIYPNMTKYLPFVFDDKNFFVNQKCFIITGQYIGFLTAFFNSSLFKYCFRDNFPELQGGTRELSKIFFETIPVIAIDDKIETNFLNAVKDIQNNYTHAKAILLDKMIFELYKLNQQEQNEIGFREIK
ncbi:TaqI-like C-terminal specificity domain-containing protein [Treponema denticola]|uniref:TaqI-like C-terminal specificity domain-containing protein n=1 Tax=Treponema denticola TaxID=158 RepID=UPI0020A3F062|nr:TaqI-like C-terminal specificity domain-containing protein [Treponema denticola]